MIYVKFYHTRSIYSTTIHDYFSLHVWYIWPSFNNISVILWRSVLLQEETGIIRENHVTCGHSLIHCITESCSHWPGWESNSQLKIVIFNDLLLLRPLDNGIRRLVILEALRTQFSAERNVVLNMLILVDVVCQQQWSTFWRLDLWLWCSFTSYGFYIVRSLPMVSILFVHFLWFLYWMYIHFRCFTQTMDIVCITRE